MIDPEFWSDEKIADLPIQARLLFIGTWNFADDEGVIKARPEFLKSNIFPYDNDITSDDVKNWFNQLVKKELLFAYADSGQQYAIILKFGKHQVINKPLVSKLPKPPTDKLPGNYVPTTVAVRSQMKGNEMKGNEEEVANTPAIPVFERKIREKGDEYRALVKDLGAHDYLSAAKIHQIVLDEFLPYWLERGENAKKARWEKEKVFDYQRRIRTWLRNVHRKDYICSEGLWHREGERCYCAKEKAVDKSKPLVPSASEAVKVMANAKRI